MGSPGNFKSKRLHSSGTLSTSISSSYLAQSSSRVSVEYLVHAAEVRKLVEELLKSCGGNNLKDAGGLIARVPERMPLASWLENEVARSAVDHLIAKQRAYASLDDPAVLIFVVVAMKR